MHWFSNGSQTKPQEATIADKNREIEAHMRMAEQCAGMSSFTARRPDILQNRLLSW